MRVRISYGMDIENVPEQAETLATDALWKLQDAVRSLEKAIANIEECTIDYSLVIEILNNIRLKLTSADLIMTDVEAILDGLNKFYENGDEDVSDRRPIVDPGGDTVDSSEE